MANNIDLKDIQLGEIIDYGGFGDVHKAIWSGKEIVASKLDYISEVHTAPLFRIIHTNIIQIYAAVDDYLLIEYVDCGSLHNYLHGEEQRDYTVMDVLHWMHQAAKGLDYLRDHDPKLVYRDINPSNLLLANKFRTLKISGICFSSKSFPVQPDEYTSPEAIKGGKASTGVCNVYSLGIVFWELMTRKKPYYHHPYTISTIGKAVLRGERPALSDIKIKGVKAILAMIENCWNPNPFKRTTISQIHSALTDNITGTQDSTLTQVLSADIGAIVDFGDIKIREKIGEGAFGVSYRATWMSKNITVKKFQRLTERCFLDQPFKKRLRELLSRKSLRSFAQIVNIYGIAMDKESTYLLSDYSDCGSLCDYLHGKEQREYSVEMALTWMLQVTEGINYLIRGRTLSPIIHNNIKPQNMMLFENFTSLKISDYCSPINDETLLNYNSDLAYVAPEFSIEGKCTAESNAFSFGIIFWEVMSRMKPFYHLRSVFDITLKILEGERPDLNDIRNTHYNFIKPMITKCWNDDPAERFTMDELFDLLRDLDHIDEKFTMLKKTVEITDIKLSEVVGTGSYGIVYRAAWQDKEIAVKKCGIFFANESTAKKNFEKEVRQLSRVDHENIVKLYGITFDNDSAYLLMDYAECGSLYSYLYDKNRPKYTMTDGINWMIQCVKGIAHMHAMKPKPMVHRDLKPHNLLLTDNFRILKIGDFGTATELATLMTGEIGTPAYIAPEVIVGTIYSEKCDIYSFGMILWEVMSRKKPFHHLPNPNRVAINFTAVQGERPPLSYILIPNCEQLQSLITKCWHSEPAQRPAIDEIQLSEIPSSNFKIKSSIKKSD